MHEERLEKARWRIRKFGLLLQLKNCLQQALNAGVRIDHKHAIVQQPERILRGVKQLALAPHLLHISLRNSQVDRAIIRQVREPFSLFLFWRSRFLLLLSNRVFSTLSLMDHNFDIIFSWLINFINVRHHRWKRLYIVILLI